MDSEKERASDEVFKITQEVKEYAKSYSPWDDAGADLVGIIPAERLDKIPSYRQDWMKTSTMKATEQMEDAKSIIVLGYHASDDIYEAILRKGNRIEMYYRYTIYKNERRLIHYRARLGSSPSVQVRPQGPSGLSGSRRLRRRCGE